MTNLGSMVWPILTLILSEKIGMNASEIAIYIMITSLVQLPMSLIGGKLADKYNKRNIIVICDILSVGGFIYCTFAQMNLLAVIIFSISGLFQTVEWPSYDALVADFTTSKDRERAYSLSYLGSNLGLMLAPTLGGLLFKDFLNIAFLINGCAILISTIFIFIFIKNVKKEEDDSEEAMYEKAIDSKTNVFKYIFKNKVLWIFILTSAIASLVYSTYSYLMPLDMTAIYGEQGSLLYGTMSSINCIIVVVATPLITRLFKKFFETKKMIIGESLIVLGYIIFVTLAKLPAFCYIAIGIFTIGEIFSTISSSPFMTKRIPSSHRGRIMSVSNVFATLLYSGAQIGIGAAYDNLGNYWAWGIICFLGLIVISLQIYISIIDKKYFKNLYFAMEVNGKNISIKSASLELLNEYYKRFKMDDSLFSNKEDMKDYLYSKERVSEYFDKISKEENRKNYVIILDGSPIGEMALRHIDYEKKEATMSIHLQNDEVKNKGYGTAAEILMIKRAFEALGFETLYADSIITNTRSQHVLEKVGFKKEREDDKFIYYSIHKQDQFSNASNIS